MIYDVSLPISPSLAVWPGDPQIETTPRADGRVKTSQWIIGSHVGTHVDSPAHFSVGPQTVDRLDLAALVGPCRVIELPDVDRITAADLPMERLRGAVRILFKTKNSALWEEDMTNFRADFVGLDLGAAEALARLKPRLVGVDGLSVQHYRGKGAHEALLREDIVILEGLRLAAIRPGDYRLICAPLLLADCDGAPARVFLED
ncbi:MAG TPA: cyclase family protein [Candidatus Brocadiia bacterium]|nr:cyclase family protein [Candidatus Brocadiia bacterium]